MGGGGKGFVLMLRKAVRGVRVQGVRILLGDRLSLCGFLKVVWLV